MTVLVVDINRLRLITQETGQITRKVGFGSERVGSKFLTNNIGFIDVFMIFSLEKQ